MRPLLLLAIPLFVVACGKPAPKAEAPAKPPAEKKEEPSPLNDQVVNLGQGKATIRDDAAKRDPLWDVEWQSAQLQVEDQGQGSGTMRGVSGTIFSEGKPVAKFSADGGRGDRQAQTLLLRGNVRVVSDSPQGTLVCDRILYVAKEKVIKAQGNVRVTSPQGTIGTMSEIWTSPDLSVVATPELFNAR